MRNRIGKWLKALAGMVVGLVLLDLFCAWYYNPASYVYDESRATDVVREPGAISSRANEGFSWTVIDENGYNNRQVPGEDGVFVLMMGSSHVEGLYVQPGEDVSSQLSEMLSERGIDGFVYNIGMSNHRLPRNIFNLDRALTRFQPSGYVMLETRTIKVAAKSVFPALDGTLNRLSASEVVISKWLSERPLLRTLYRQFMTLRLAEGAMDAEDEEPEFEITQEVLDLYLEKMTELFGIVHDVAAAHGVTPIIYYHPELVLQEDGSAVPGTDERVLRVFAEACDAAGVRFLDLTDRLLEAYERDYTLPHGFINTVPGTGHLNARGNRLVAEALCDEIERQEAGR